MPQRNLYMKNLLKKYSELNILFFLIVILLIKALPLRLLFVNFIAFDLENIFFNYLELLVLNFICLGFVFYILKRYKYKISFYNIKETNVIYFLPLVLALLIFTNIFSNIKYLDSYELPLCIILIYSLNIFFSAFLEELFFRGFTLSFLLNHNYKNVSIIIIKSALLFGLPHFINFFNKTQDIYSILYQVIFAISLGFLYSAVYLKTKSLIVLIFFHFINNVVSNIDDLIVKYEKITISVNNNLTFLQLIIETSLVCCISVFFIFLGVIILRKVDFKDVIFFKLN